LGVVDGRSLFWLSKVMPAIAAEVVIWKVLRATFGTQQRQFHTASTAELPAVRVVGLALWTFHRESFNPS
jgi:hypothetical protein